MTSNWCCRGSNTLAPSLSLPLRAGIPCCRSSSKGILLKSLNQVRLHPASWHPLSSPFVLGGTFPPFPFLPPLPFLLLLVPLLSLVDPEAGGTPKLLLSHSSWASQGAKSVKNSTHHGQVTPLEPTSRLTENIQGGWTRRRNLPAATLFSLAQLPAQSSRSRETRGNDSNVWRGGMGGRDMTLTKKEKGRRP